jgi:hypothetical protein
MRAENSGRGKDLAKKLLRRVGFHATVIDNQDGPSIYPGRDALIDSQN